ncbi:hypothetical protein [Halocatena halophila]|uniref:hypothetical protein n=1 Tax=Halocatena halophila TaxID=2814576 RepID=UPI002ED2065A
MTSDLSISVGFPFPPVDADYTSFVDGGIRVEIDGTALTQYTESNWDRIMYDKNGDEVTNSDEYVGMYLSFTLMHLKEAIIRYSIGDIGRYEEVPAEIGADEPFGCFVLSFCDGDDIRIAFQPITEEHRDFFSTRVAIGYAVSPRDLCEELLTCYQDCFTYVDNYHGDESWNDPMWEAYEWSQNNIQDLQNVLDENSHFDD